MKATKAVALNSRNSDIRALKIRHPLLLAENQSAFCICKGCAVLAKCESAIRYSGDHGSIEGKGKTRKRSYFGIFLETLRMREKNKIIYSRFL